MEERPAGKRPLTTEQIARRIHSRLLDGRGPCMEESATANVGTVCYYRSTDGTNCCAVGALIADEHYKRSLEEQGVDNDAVIRALALSGVPWTLQNAALLRTAQSYHDIPDNWNGTQYEGPLDWLEPFLEELDCTDMTEQEKNDKEIERILSANILSSEDLDDLVHEVCADIAARVNNEGTRAQLELIYQHGYTVDTLLDSLKEESTDKDS